MVKFNYAIKNYGFIKALSWGNCKEHWDKSVTGDLNGRKVHRFIAIVEAVPIFGQIASLFEFAIVKLFGDHPVEEVLIPAPAEAESIPALVESTPQEMLLSLSNKNFDQILSLITPNVMNMDIYVIEGDNREKRYLLATEEQNTKPILDGQLPKNQSLDDYRHTTTLANIFLTNELNFNHDQIVQLVRKLISLKADFSKCDYTNYRGIPHYAAINNAPLQSLIALGASDPNNFDRDFNRYDDIIRELINFILKQPYASGVFNHIDNFQMGRMSPTTFLIRQGKEKLAELIIDSGLVELGHSELLIAAESFGTNGRDSIDCLPKILHAMRQQNKTIPEHYAKQAIQFLMNASPYLKHDKDNLHVRIGKVYDENYPNLQDSPYFKFLEGREFNSTDKSKLKKEIVAGAYKLQFGNAESNFSDYYRDDQIPFFGKKYDYLGANKGLEKQIDNLIEQITSLSDV